MRALLLTTLLITACLSGEEASISKTSDAVTKDHLTDSNNPAYIKPDECLIAIDGEHGHKLGDTITLPRRNQCLPSSKLSWLFKAESVTEEIQTEHHLKLAILLDTSFSLSHNDPAGQRYGALRKYLLALYEKIISEENKNAKVHIASADIEIYPFKYCSSRGEEKFDLWTMTGTKRGGEDGFETLVDNLIGSKGTYDNEGSAEDVRAEKSFDKLTGYGAVGSTNYLQSLHQATKFFEKYDDEENKYLKQVLIFSDGLPFTFNDGTNNTINLNDPGCEVTGTTDLEYLRGMVIFSGKFEPKPDIKKCLTTAGWSHPSALSCTRPTGGKMGQTTNGPAAWSDPLNHVLGMVQHHEAISVLKKSNNFQVYTVLLKPDNCNNVPDEHDKIICEKITQPLAKPFFESFADHYVEANLASGLAAKFNATLQAQTQKLEYEKKGEAYIEAEVKGETSQIDVDDPTILHDGQRIKVGRDKITDRVHDYTHSRETLTVAHGLKNKDGKFYIDYDFKFGGEECRASNPVGVGDLEAHKYSGAGYTAWCLLHPLPPLPPNPPAPECEDREGKRERCKAANEKNVWVDDECMCAEVPVELPCVPSDIVCCKDDTPYNVENCNVKGQIWNNTTCSCETSTVPPVVPPIVVVPEPSTCNRATECCDPSGNPMTSTACSPGDQWKWYPECGCVPRANPPIVINPPPPSPPTVGPGNEDGNGKNKEPEEPPPTTLPAATEGIVYGDFENF